MKIIPIGGLDEVGKNMTIIESDKDIVIIDAGIGFIKKKEIPGIEIAIPDITYLEENLLEVLAIIFLGTILTIIFTAFMMDKLQNPKKKRV